MLPKSPRECLQPSLTAGVASRWIDVNPASVAMRSGRPRSQRWTSTGSTKRPRTIEWYSGSSPRGTDAEFAALDTEFATTDDDIFGARQLADRLVAYFPESSAALRVQGYAALRADDPAAAVRSVQRGARGREGWCGYENGRWLKPMRSRIARCFKDLWRARILAGDSRSAAGAGASAVGHATRPPLNRLDYALLLMTAQRDYGRADAARNLGARPNGRARGVTSARPDRFSGRRFR